ncbi:hypothetical protein N4Q65_05805 [Salmonella enterica subsp. enterica serovar Pomona]
MSTTTLTRREQRAKAQHFIDTLEGTAFPNSKRIYVTGSQHDIRVPMREIQLSPSALKPSILSIRWKAPHFPTRNAST